MQIEVRAINPIDDKRLELGVGIVRFNPDAYTAYPILRPNSSDYLSGEFDATLHAVDDGAGSKTLKFDLDFRISEPTVESQVAEGNAVCCAQVYCATTCYTTMLKANNGSMKIRAEVPRDFLRGRVEVHPSVIAVRDIELPLDKAHPEYGGGSMLVGKYRQLASAMPWHFGVGYTNPRESVFHLQKDDKAGLEDGEYDIVADPTEKYIVISANSKTFDVLQDVRGARNVELTTATVYLVALTDALSLLEAEVQDDEDPTGWATAVRSRLKEIGIRLDSNISTGLAAQRLLGGPLAHLKEMSEEA